jgi:hypothetical protein
VDNNQALGVVDTPGPGVAVQGASFNSDRSYLVFWRLTEPIGTAGVAWPSRAAARLA